MEKMSISFNQSHKSSISHNNRTNTHGNPDIDLDRLQENITYKVERIEDKYHEIFDESVQAYNQKQKRSDRKIENYYEKIRNDSKTHAQRELVVAVGKKEDSPDLIEHKKRILDMYAKDFENRNPNLAVYNMVMHNDEANPHLHINYVPNFDSKRGLGKRVGMDKALQQQGVEGSGKELIKNWRGTETDYIQKIAEATLPEFNRATVGSHKYMNVAEYKDFAQEIEFLKVEKELLEKDVSELKIELSEEKETLEREKVAFEAKNAEMDFILRNKDTFEEERDYFKAERENELKELERIKKTNNAILAEDEIPNVPIRPIHTADGSLPTEAAVNLKDFRKLQQQAKKATSAQAMVDYYEEGYSEETSKRIAADNKVRMLQLEVDIVKTDRDSWKNRFKALQNSVRDLFEGFKEKFSLKSIGVLKTNTAEVLAENETKTDQKDLKTALDGHYDKIEYDNHKQVTEAEFEPQRFINDQEMDW